MRQGRGILNLRRRRKRNCHSEQPGAGKKHPVVRVAHEIALQNDLHFTCRKNDRNEEENGVDVVVQSNFPRAVINQGKLFLHIYRVKRDEDGGGYSGNRADKRPVDLLGVAEGEAGENDCAAAHGGKRGDLGEDEAVEYDVENNSE